MMPSRTPRAARKHKLKMRYRDNIDAEINKAMDKVWLLCEIKCDLRNEANEARAKPIRDALKADQRAARLARRKPKSLHNEWGKEITE